MALLVAWPGLGRAALPIARAKNALDSSSGTKGWVRKVAASKSSMALLEFNTRNGFDAIKSLGPSTIDLLLPRIATAKNKSVALALKSLRGSALEQAKAFLAKNGLARFKAALGAIGALHELYYQHAPSEAHQGHLHLDLNYNLWETLGFERYLALGTAVQAHRNAAGLFVIARGPAALLDLAKSGSPAQLEHALASFESLIVKDAHERRAIFASHRPRDRRGRYVKTDSTEHQESILTRVASKRAPTILFRGEDRGGQLPFQVFEHGFVPHDVNANTDPLTHLVSSRGSSFVSSTSRTEVAWIYAGVNGIVYSIDPTKVAGQEVDSVLREHSPKLAAGSVPRGGSGKALDILIGPKGEQILNQGTGEWIHAGGIPARAVRDATIYQAGRVVGVLKNPNYAAPPL